MPLFSNLSCPIPIQPLLYVVQNVADWVVPFLRSQHFPHLPLKLFHTLPSILKCTKIMNNHHHLTYNMKNLEENECSTIAHLEREERLDTEDLE